MQYQRGFTKFLKQILESYNIYISRLFLHFCTLCIYFSITYAFYFVYCQISNPLFLPIYIMENNFLRSFEIRNIWIWLYHIGTSNDGYENHISPSVTNTTLESMRQQMDDSNHDIYMMYMITDQMTIIFNQMMN